MAQFARPDSDITTLFGVTPSGTHYTTVDEAVADDNDYVTCNPATTDRYGLSNVTDPEVGTGHVVRWRARATGSGAGEKLLVRLFEGVTQRATSGAVTTTRNSFNDYSLTLSTGEADAITNYANLEVQIQDSTLGSGETIDVSQIYLEVPDAAVAYTLECDAGSYSITGKVAILVISRNIALSSGSYVVTGLAATLTYTPGGYTIELDAGSYSLTGQAANLSVGRALAADQGSYAIIGKAAGLIVARALALDQGSYSISGQHASMLVGRVLAMTAGSYTVSGQSATLLVARALSLDLGSYTVTGLDVTLTYTPVGGYTIILDLGSYTVAEQTANLLVDRSLALDAGSYAITGQPANVLHGYLLDLAQGSYTVTGQDAGFVLARLLVLAVAAYAITGNATTLNYSGAAPSEGGGLFRRGLFKGMTIHLRSIL